MRKLSNDELATRTREANRRRGERARERLTIAGRAALTVWLPVGLRRDFVNEAAACGVNISELATRLIEKGLRESRLINSISSAIAENSEKSENSTIVESAIADPETADLFATPEPQTPVVADTASTHTTVSVSLDRDAMMALVAEYIVDGLTGADIARKLTAAGYKSQQGTELRGANVLREYRAWKEKSDADK